MHDEVSDWRVGALCMTEVQGVQRLVKILDVTNSRYKVCLVSLNSVEGGTLSRERSIDELQSCKGERKKKLKSVEPPIAAESSKPPPEPIRDTERIPPHFMHLLIPSVGSLCWFDIEGCRYLVKVIKETNAGYKIQKMIIGGMGEVFPGVWKSEDLVLCTDSTSEDDLY